MSCKILKARLLVMVKHSMRILLCSLGSQDSYLSRQKPGGNRLKAKQAKVNQRVLARDELPEDSCPFRHSSGAVRLVGP